MTRQNRPTRPELTCHGRTDTSDGSVTGPNLQNPTPVGRVAVSILKNPIYLTRPTKPQKKASQLRSGHDWPSFTQIRSNPHFDKLKSGESSPDRLKLSQTPVCSTLTRPNLGHISIDTKEHRLNLVRSGQISAKIR